MRRLVLWGAIGLLVTACAPQGAIVVPEAAPSAAEVEAVPPAAASAQPAAVPVQPVATAAPAPRTAPDPALVGMYASRNDGGWTVPAIDVTRHNARFFRQRVTFETREAPGTIIIDTASRHLYLVEPGGMAMRYGVSIGREGFGWKGEGRIGRKARWPRWTPPAEMIARDPSLAQWRDGMPGGPRNPLGSRALYIYFGDQDSLYRIHGTNEPRSIGRNASSGCFRMFNHDAIDLHARVSVGAKVVVR